MIIYYKIFKIDEPTLFYIGSTKNFSRRKCHHKKNIRNKVGKLYHTLLYRTIREKGGWDKFEMVKIMEKEDHELRFLEEQAIISIYNPPLNTNRSSRQKPSDELINKLKELII